MRFATDAEYQLCVRLTQERRDARAALLKAKTFADKLAITKRISELSHQIDKLEIWRN